jgi:hypothetical protein
MELVTTEIFETQRRQKARHLSADIDEDDEQIEEQGPKKDAEPDIRLFLKSKGLEEVKITVKPSTTVARLIAVFRSQRNIGEEKAVALVFDGDRLASGSTAADNDLDDMDSIEVHIK